MEVTEVCDDTRTKPVVVFGNTSHVTLPKEWRGRTVLVLLLPNGKLP